MRKSVLGKEEMRGERTGGVVWVTSEERQNQWRKGNLQPGSTQNSNLVSRRPPSLPRWTQGAGKLGALAG